MAGFDVPGWMDRLGGFIERHPRLILRLADMETRVLADRLAREPVRAPIFISGLARAGTTILLEALARHPDVGTHQYRDYPPVLLPYAWPWLLRFMETREQAPAERAHGDRILVTPRSPEAMEEALWRAFFPGPPSPRRGDVLRAEDAHPMFVSFYRAHAGKLLLVRGARRYLAKGNYNVTRIACIRAVFPDARFIVPVRSPAGHVASLVRQHRRFTAGLRDNPRGRAHLRRVGHFEFGPDRRPVDTGGEAPASVARLWAAGEEVRGWARSWALVYAHVADLLERDPALAGSVRIVRYEDFCARPADELSSILRHALLEPPAGMVEEFAARVSAPDYYPAGFEAADLDAIREETAAVAARYGYR